MKKKLLIVFLSLLLLAGCKDVKLKNGENAVVTFKKGAISSDELYTELKNTYGAEKIMDLIDSFLLKDLYKEDKDEKAYVKQSIKSIKESAKQSNVDFNLYLNYYYGVADEEAFKNYLSLNYKRDLWKNDYAKEVVSDKQINDYYEQMIFGDIDASLILITAEASKDADENAKTEAENKALEKANNIIKELKEGKDFASLAKANSEDETSAQNGGAVGEVNSDSVPSEVWEALNSMKDGSYSTSPVKSTNGYYILYRTSQKEKPELNDEVKKTIIEKVAEEIVIEPGFNVKAQKALREKNEMKFVDTNLENAYNDLLTKYENQQTSN